VKQVEQMAQPFVHELFRRTAEAHPRHAAVSCGDKELSYDQLDSASERMAADLVGRGCGTGAIVGVYLEPGIEYVTSILAVLKAGGIYFPLSMDFPVSRLAALLGLAEGGLVVTGAGFEPVLDDLFRANPQIGERFGRYIIDMGVLDRTGVLERKRPGGSGHDACYLLSTSGSTGEPKAILGSHKGLCHFIEWEIREFELGQDTRVSWLSHPTFDVSLRDIFVPLCCGGTLVIPEKQVRTSPKPLYRWLEDRGVTLTHIVPTLFRLLLGAIEGQPGRGKILADLKYAMTAGEALYGSDAIRWRKVVGDHAKLVNLYGPSETTLAKLFYPVDVSKLEPDAIVPLGKPIPGARAYIIKDGRVCDTGEEGEIHIETEYRSLGYYRNPQLTDKVFIRNPVDPGAREPLYRTGDMGKLLEDGNIQFAGRTDRQVKLRGIRVELGEIETILAQNPKVGLAAASVDVDDKGDQRLVAYLVPKAGEGLYIEALRGFMAERLPDYMNPNVYVILDSLPLTASGKIDRTKLPSPERTRPRLEQAFAGASNRVEEELVRLWGEALGIPSVGIDDNFFDLGGTSILAVRLTDTIGKAFRIDLPVVKLFEFPRIRLLARYLAREDAAGPATEDHEERARRKRMRRARASTK
jgi:amino acid adenylation domain-containing protein